MHIEFTEKWLNDVKDLPDHATSADDLHQSWAKLGHQIGRTAARGNVERLGEWVAAAENILPNHPIVSFVASVRDEMEAIVKGIKHQRTALEDVSAGKKPYGALVASEFMEAMTPEADKPSESVRENVASRLRKLLLSFQDRMQDAQENNSALTPAERELLLVVDRAGNSAEEMVMSFPQFWTDALKEKAQQHA